MRHFVLTILFVENEVPHEQQIVRPTERKRYRPTLIQKKKETSIWNMDKWLKQLWQASQVDKGNFKLFRPTAPHFCDFGRVQYLKTV
jgi:hypothetical protein